MDQPDVDPAGLSAGLEDLRAVNRWLGGRQAALRRILELTACIPGMKPLRVLDVGTGAADLPIALRHRQADAGRELTVVGIDLHPETVAHARLQVAEDDRISIVQGDALDLPFGDDAFDLAMCNTTLHHFDPVDARRALAEMGRVARWGIVVTDLARSWPALLGARLLAATVWRGHPVTRHDGPSSVRAAYTPEELRLMAIAVFGSHANLRVRREWLFRISLVVDRTPHCGG